MGFPGPGGIKHPPTLPGHGTGKQGKNKDRSRHGEVSALDMDQKYRTHDPFPWRAMRAMGNGAGSVQRQQFDHQ
jgi:hypothetical protein